MGNTFGTVFRITTFGESHGEGLGVIIDGCPAGIEISLEEIQAELDRRRPGQNRFTTPRKEKDQVRIMSGIFEGVTLGTPIALIIENHDAHSKSYDDIAKKYRPGHADYTYDQKFGRRDWRGGGRASARETAARVAAGAIAKKLLSHHGMSIGGYVTQLGTVSVINIDPTIAEDNPLRCPDASVLEAMKQEVEDARAAGDSVGGIVEIVATGAPAGLGEPVFDKLPALLGHAMMSIPAVKGFEIGAGFKAASMRGSESNDEFEKTEDGIRTKTNNAGGTLGGISNGEDIVVRFALKPPSSIIKEQQTVDQDGNETPIQVHGRHDPCVCPRAVPIGEAMMALVLADLLLINRSSQL